MKSFLLANVPLSMLHFILFLIFKGFLGQPGCTPCQGGGYIIEDIFFLDRSTDHRTLIFIVSVG